MNKSYKNLIWTNHVLKRLSERGITQSEAYAVWYAPEKTRYAVSRGGWVYEKTLGRRIVEVVAKKNNRGEWLILSAWSRPIGSRRVEKEGVLTKLFRFLFK